MAVRRQKTWNKACHKAQLAVAEQEAWIKRCGGNFDGYIRNYGRKSDPVHSGDGAEAIYKADVDELNQLKWRLHALTPKHLLP